MTGSSWTGAGIGVQPRVSHGLIHMWQESRGAGAGGAALRKTHSLTRVFEIVFSVSLLS